MMVIFQCLIGILLIANNSAFNICEEMNPDVCECKSDTSIKCGPFNVETNAMDNLIIMCERNANIAEFINIFKNDIEVENDVFAQTIELNGCPIKSNTDLSKLPVFKMWGHKIPVILVISATDEVTLSMENFFRNIKTLNALSIITVNSLKINSHTFALCDTLQRLEISKNNEVVLENPINSFFGLSMLQILKILDNRNSYIHRNTFFELIWLNKLYIVRNNLEEINSEQFINQEYLTELDLSYNEINKVTKESFKGLKTLKILNLSYNNLKELTKSAFKELKSLEILDLSYNNIKKLTIESMYGLISLRILYLRGNNKLETDIQVIQDFLPNNIQALI